MSTQVAEMLQVLDTRIKVALDLRWDILAGGGAVHADCESVLLKVGRRQEDI
jgi:hypothetical protein